LNLATRILPLTAASPSRRGPRSVAAAPEPEAAAGREGPGVFRLLRDPAADESHLLAAEAVGVGDAEVPVEVPEHRLADAATLLGAVPGGDRVGEVVVGGFGPHLVRQLIEVAAESLFAELRIAGRVADELGPGLVDRPRRHPEDGSAAPSAADEPLA